MAQVKADEKILPRSVPAQSNAKGVKVTPDATAEVNSATIAASLLPSPMALPDQSRRGKQLSKATPTMRGRPRGNHSLNQPME